MTTMANAKQQKLRQLMKEKKALENTKINSPIARYNSLGQLSCVLCNVPVKSNILWTAHVQSKKHKETVALLKAQKETTIFTTTNKNKNDCETASPVTPDMTATQKRKQRSDVDDDNDERASAAKEAKKPKVDNSEATATSPVTLVESKSDTIDIEKGSHDVHKDTNKSSHDIGKQSLPADFFDGQQSVEVNDNDTNQNETVTKGKERSDSSSQLPQGFFDDPKVDAKVRKVEYKDPELAEWEKFKKSIIEENKISDTIVDEEDDEAKVDREITELSEQSECYSKAELLRQKQELYHQKRAEFKHRQMENVSMMTTPEPDQTSDSEHEELEEFLNWRSKVV